MRPTTSKTLILRSPDTVIVSVTSHRFLHHIEELIAPIDHVLDAIQARWPERGLTIISSLAEGGDRLVTQRALAMFQARLVVPLPMPEDEYSLDFAQAGSDQEFRRLLGQASEIVRFPSALDRPAAYATAGDYMLTQSDVLIALWDGQPAHGAGGTATVVAAARRMAHPMVWIRACNCRPGQLDPTPRYAQGKISYENF